MTDTDGNSGSGDMHIPDVVVSGDDFDFSAMADITRQNPENQNFDSDDEYGGEGEAAAEQAGETEDRDSENELETSPSSEDTDGYEDGEREESVVDPKEAIVFKAGDKELPVPKDAEVQLKINGKMETMTLQEALNQASGGINVSREINRVKQREQEHEKREASFREQTAQVNANAEALMEIKDPYELCEYIADLKGGDPDQIFQDLLKSTVENFNRIQNMTEREIQLDRENRRYKRIERQNAAKAKVQNAAKEQETKVSGLRSSLEAEGFTYEDFQNHLNMLAEKAQAGEELGFDLDTSESLDENEIILHMVATDLDKRLKEGVSKLNEGLLEDTEFIGKATQAILKIEAISGKMTQAELNKFLKGALELDNDALNKSLSKKVSKTKSQRVTLNGQEEFDDEGPGSLEDLNEMLRNL